jgi:glycosyltransferase involved in cell wall biosynthesis
MIKILVDGIIFQKDPHGGIARMFREILPRMCVMEPELRVKLFIDGPLHSELPSHPQIIIQKAPAIKRRIRVRGTWELILYPARRIASRLWNLTRSFWLGRGQGVIWHSSFYTVPDIWVGLQVVTVHDMIHERFPGIFNTPFDEVARKQKRRCIDHADAVICVSESTRQDVERWYGHPAGKMNIIPSAYNDLFHQLTHEEIDIPGVHEQPFILYVGNRARYKNYQGLIEIYSQWQARKDFKLVVVGGLWTMEEKQHLERLGITERVQLYHNIDDRTLCKLYNQALAFVYPSLYEGFGVPLLEAMACGCPIIASRIPPTLEVAGDCPIYFEPSQPATLLAALDQVISEGKDSTRIKNSLTRVHLYSWDRTARETLDVYRSLPERHHSSSETPPTVFDG